MTSRRATLPAFRTQVGAPLIAYYGSLIDEVLVRHDQYPYVADSTEAEQVLPTLTRTPIAAIRSGDFQGDYVVMVSIPWILPESFGDDEYTFELEA